MTFNLISMATSPSGLQFQLQQAVLASDFAGLEVEMHHSCKGTTYAHYECVSNPGLHTRARSWQTLALFPGFTRWYQYCSSFVMPGMGRSEMGIITIRHPSLHVYPISTWYHPKWSNLPGLSPASNQRLEMGTAWDQPGNKARLCTPYHILPSKEYCWGLAKVVLSLCLHLIDLCTLHRHIYRQGQTETRWKERRKPNCVRAKGGSHKQCCYHKTNQQRYYQEFLPLSSCSASITGWSDWLGGS